MRAERAAPARALAIAAALVAPAGACHKGPAGATSVSEPAAMKRDAEGPIAAPLVAGPRCHPAMEGIDVGARNQEDLEVGDVAALPDGHVAIGTVHRTASGRVAAVLRSLGPTDQPREPEWLDLAPTLGDAPPTKVVVHAGPAGTDLVAAAYLLGSAGTRSSRDAARNLALYALSPGLAAAPAPVLVVPQQRDDSLAFDLAFAGPSGLLVWDEAAGPSRGVIRAVAFDAADAAVANHDISPPESDAELPRLVADATGFVAVWVARRPEPGRAADASEPEATGETRSFGWIESVRLDARGVATGPVRVLTSTTGHVSAYDVATLGEPDRTILVVARDDGESVDGSGGALVRVRIVGGTPEPPVEFQSDGLGRGAPNLVDGSALFLAWVGPGEQGRLLPLDRAGAPLGPPSAEDLLDDARPLRALGEGIGEPGRATLLVARTLSGAPAAQVGASMALLTVACSR
jgi:hypothetical protein